MEGPRDKHKEQNSNDRNNHRQLNTGEGFRPTTESFHKCMLHEGGDKGNFPASRFTVALGPG